MNCLSTGMWSITQSQTFWSVKLSGLLVDLMEFQQSYWNSSTIPRMVMISTCCTQYISKSGRPSSGHRTGKGQSSSQFPRRVVLWQYHVPVMSNVHHRTTAFIYCASKVILKILHSRIQHYVNQELPGVQAQFRKGIGTIDQIANICWIIEKAGELQKNIYLCSTDYTKSLTVWIITNCGKLLKRWGYQPILLVS